MYFVMFEIILSAADSFVQKQWTGEKRRRTDDDIDNTDTSRSSKRHKSDSFFSYAHIQVYIDSFWSYWNQYCGATAFTAGVESTYEEPKTEKIEYNDTCETNDQNEFNRDSETQDNCGVGVDDIKCKVCVHVS